MQASTTKMLDSTLSKVLTNTAAKQVESPLPIDAGEDNQKNIILDSNNQSASISSEAEVRLVVRFTVEEQIVYKGKIRKVNPLDSQELSRIVSRVAWNNQLDEDATSPPLAVPIDSVQDHINDNTNQVAIKPPIGQRSFHTQTEPTTEPPALPEIPASNLTKELELERATSNTRSSDHVSYVKPNPISPRTSPESEKNSIAQVEKPQEEPTRTTDCDIVSVEPLPNHICEAGQQILPNSPPIQENDRNHHHHHNHHQQELPEPADDSLSGNNNSDETSDLSPTSMVDDASIESQSIADTLNDCVYIVDLESRQQALKHTDVTPAHTNPSGKRMRRTVPKDHRNSTTRTSASKNSENNTSPRQQITAPTKNGQTLSLLANTKQPRPKVFARWSDNHFYPGTIVRLKDRKYVINFFDGAQRNVAETDLIPLDNIEGKQVRVSIAKNYCVNAIVHDQSSPVDDQPMFDVEYQQDGIVRKCVPFKDIFLTGEQGTPLIMQTDKNHSATNFADVDLDNIIYEKRSRRLQELEDYELTENSSVSNKRKRGQYTNILGQEIYFTRSSPHRTKQSLLL